MKRVLIWLLEHLIGTYREGPNPPARIGDVVLEFAQAFPRATRNEWIDFAVRHAGTSYREGYVRGYEWVERLPSAPEAEPEAVMRVIDPDGEWLERPVDPTTGLPVDCEPVTDEVDVSAEIAREARAHAAYAERMARGPVIR
jgi:hypothetical protein